MGDRSAARPLDQGWVLVGTAAGEVLDPAGLGTRDWRPAIVPGTVAQALDLDLDHPGELDGRDWWYRRVFDAAGIGGAAVLELDGLATVAEVWLNGTKVLQSTNMFRGWRVRVHPRPGENERVLGFRSLRAALGGRRARPRWKTALVAKQELRWARTTLLGRIPGWTPAVPAVGPWRAVRLRCVDALDPAAVSVRTELVGRDGALAGRVAVGVELGEAPIAASVTVDGRSFALHVEPLAAGARVDGVVEVSGIAPWWPHTHGAPALYPCALTLRFADGTEDVVDLGPVGFRTVAFDPVSQALVVNGRRVFARGACWPALDVRSIDGTPAKLAEALRLCVTGGMNMVRVGGTMVYGTDAFYRACDALGVLVWQDFMFANMDYPFADPAFSADVLAEVDGQLHRLQRHPCVAVYCGGSEVEQQAAMVGLPASEWSGPFFQDVLPARVAALHPGVPYVPSTPTGGALPFSTAAGITHYYGVGAYRRPLSDARLAGVRFTAECLGFANVPDAETVERIAGGGVPHHPAWKAGVPRDGGAGWDFEDTRDHYLRVLYGLDPLELRSTDLERYLAMSRAVTAEVLTRVYAEWRRPGSTCQGALTWFLTDLRLGAGWGVIDSTLRPKSAWWALRRAFSSRAVAITDEGLDGVGIHVHNETAEPLDAVLEVELLAARRVARAAITRAPLRVDPWSSVTLSGDALFGTFHDLAYGYRFGPPRHDAVAARIVIPGQRVEQVGGQVGGQVGEQVVSEDTWFVHARPLPMQDPAVLSGSAVADSAAVVVTLETTALLQAVTLSATGYTPDDNGFHLCPGRPRVLRFTPSPTAKPFKLHVTALNLDGLLTLRPIERF